MALGRLQARRGDDRGGRRRSTTPGSSRWRARSCSGSPRPRRRGRSTRGSTATWPAPPPRRAPTYHLAVDAASRGRAPSSRSGCGARASRSPRAPTIRSRTRSPWPATGGGAAAAFASSASRTSAPTCSRRPTTRRRGWRRWRSLDRLGAVRSASHLRRRLRADGVRRIPRGPRPASRAGLAGLTPRETEVLELLVRGRDERGDRPVARDLAEDRRPPRVVGAREARRGLATRGGRGGGEAHRHIADGLTSHEPGWVTPARCPRFRSPAVP